MYLLENINFGPHYFDDIQTYHSFPMPFKGEGQLQLTLFLKL